MSTVDASDWGVLINRKKWANKGEWNIHIDENVGKRLHQGDKPQYFVTLTKQ